DAKDIYYYLDIPSDNPLFEEWLEEYLEWLFAAKNEAKMKNNHGTWYELQVMSICRRLGLKSDMVQRLPKIEQMFADQFDFDGRQPYELSRPTSLHYCAYNLSGWLALSKLTELVGLSFTERLKLPVR